MQQCQNHWQAWHILQCAQSRRSGRKEEKLREKSGNCAAAVVSRARRRLSMRGAAYSAGRAVIFSMTLWTCSLRETQRHSHTDTQRHAHRLSWSPGIVRVRVAKVFGPWPSSRMRACLYSASARSTVLSPGSFRSR